ncbi:MAG TPA: hypothetical protein PKC79_13880 [Solidesulfovibrio magneticus]|nr:hypothetical protein [Solidesulfovibrio magneticus]
MPGDFQERRMVDVESTHNFSKNAAQAMILVNGGAVTAMFASQSEIVKKILTVENKSVACALMFFSLGVLCGVLMHWCERQALYHFSQRWQLLADFKGLKKYKVTKYIVRHKSRGEKWHYFSALLFVLSATFFVVGCAIIAVILWINKAVDVGSVCCFVFIK